MRRGEDAPLPPGGAASLGGIEARYIAAAPKREAMAHDPLPPDADLALAWAGTLPIAGVLAGATDQAALLDCLRVRFALSLHGS